MWKWKLALLWPSTCKKEKKSLVKRLIQISWKAIYFGADEGGGVNGLKFLPKLWSNVDAKMN